MKIPPSSRIIPLLRAARAHFPRAGLLAAIAALAFVPAVRAAADAPTADAPAASGWALADQILARIHAPVFPDRDFPITRYGAAADGQTDCTAAIRAAIAACHAAGGGRVLVPPGDWLTGAIHLLSNVNLHLEADATLKFLTDPAAYLPAVYTRFEGIECYNYSPLIYAYEQENIAITGPGTLDGQADETHWWPWKGREKIPGAPTQAAADRRLIAMGESNTPVTGRQFGMGDYLRPNFIQPYRCRNVLIEGVSIRRSPMWEVNPVLCENVIVRGLDISSHGPNNDGCDPSSCRDVLIEGCTFDTGDDCIAIKSGRNNDGRRVNVPSENIIIRNCVMKDGHGGVVIGSEISGGCRNVFAENCRMDSPNLDRALRIKTNAERGGTVENVYLRDIDVGQVSDAAILVDYYYEEGDHGAHTPVVRNIQVERMTCHRTPRVFSLRAYQRSPVDDVRVTDSTFLGVKKPDILENVAHLELTGCTVTPAGR